MRHWYQAVHEAGWRTLLAALAAVILTTFTVQIAVSPAVEARSKSQVNASCLKRSDYYRGQRGGGCKAAFGGGGVARDLCEAWHKGVSACYDKLFRCLDRVGSLDGLFTSCEVCRVRYHGCMADSRDAIRDDYFRWRK